MKKFRKANIKRIISAAIVSVVIASAVGYTFVSSAADTITLVSSGRFEYDADGNGAIDGAAGDIILDSDDLVALKNAVTGLNSSLTAISTKAYGTDGKPNYTGKLKDASGNTISGNPDDLESKYYGYQTSHSYTDTQYSNLNTEYSNYKSSHSYTNTQYETISNVAANSCKGVQILFWDGGNDNDGVLKKYDIGDTSGINLYKKVESWQSSNVTVYGVTLGYNISGGKWTIRYCGYGGNGNDSRSHSEEKTLYNVTTSGNFMQLGTPYTMGSTVYYPEKIYFIGRNQGYSWANGFVAVACRED